MIFNPSPQPLTPSLQPFICKARRKETFFRGIPLKNVSFRLTFFLTHACLECLGGGPWRPEGSIVIVVFIDIGCASSIVSGCGSSIVIDIASSSEPWRALGSPGGAWTRE